jgi:NADPH:quinone reductase-like Zn-dependent oxidoreductase
MAVSLQYRDLMVAKNIYPMKMKDDVVPCSDLAGVVIATGDAVKNWRKGDRVCSDFSLDHIDGDITPEIKDTGLGAPIDGVLREYIVLPDHVISPSFVFTPASIYAIQNSLSSNSPSISPLWKPQRYLVPV